MSMQGFQRALIDLTLAPSKATALRKGDVSTLTTYELTGRERRRILSIVDQPGISVHCSLSRGNRFEMIAQPFPMTCVLLETVLRSLLDELWQEQLPNNYQLSGEEDVFAGFLKRKLDAGELTLEYVKEIFNYELACLELSRKLRDQDDSTEPLEAIVEFEHQPGELLEPLSRLRHL